MQSTGPLAEGILEVLDPDSGGVYSAGVEAIVEILEKRGTDARVGTVQKAINRLVREGKVERIKTEGGGLVYARPGVLLRAAGVASVIRNRSGAP